MVALNTEFATPGIRPEHDDSGSILMAYYGFRYYDPATGRWPSRDPVAERGFNALTARSLSNEISRVNRVRSQLQAGLQEIYSRLDGESEASGDLATDLAGILIYSRLINAMGSIEGRLQAQINFGPRGVSSSLNAYRFVANNPISLVDYLGLCETFIDWSLLTPEEIAELIAFNDELDQFFEIFDPSGSALMSEFALEAFEFALEYGFFQASASGGFGGVGGSLGLKLSNDGLSFDVGIGFGVGGGASVVVGGQSGESNQTNFNLDVGNGFGGTFTGGLDGLFDSIDQGLGGSTSSGGSPSVSGGLGWGIGLGASATTNWSVDLIEF